MVSHDFCLVAQIMHVLRILSAVTSVPALDGHGAPQCLAIPPAILPATSVAASPWQPAPPGFIAEGFVKPPVDIILRLPKPSDVTAVVFAPKVGSLVSQSIVVLVAGAAASADRLATWHTVGQWDVQPVDEDALCALCQPRVNSATTIATVLGLSPDTSKIVAKPFDRNLRCLYNVEQVMVRILRGRGSRAIVLGQVRLIGLGEPEALPLPALSAPPTESVTAEPLDSVHVVDPPEWMLDELTQTPMSDPVILPSGHVIDRGNAIRHLRSHRSDPFTNERMSRQQLVPAESLRRRIDEYRLRLSVATDPVSSQRVGRSNDETLAHTRGELYATQRRREQADATLDQAKRTRHT